MCGERQTFHGRRSWRKLYDEGGFKGLTRFESGGSPSHLSKNQKEEEL
jgi:hypothetical protein